MFSNGLKFIKSHQGNLCSQSDPAPALSGRQGEFHRRLALPAIDLDECGSCHCLHGPMPEGRQLGDPPMKYRALVRLFQGNPRKNK